MKDLYEVDRESLVEFSKKIYEEACLGYMDLKDSVCEKFVEEFLKNKNAKKIDGATNVNVNAMNWTVNTLGNWLGDGVHFGSRSTLSVDPASNIASPNNVILRNLDQDMLRGNYHGNESERI